MCCPTVIRNAQEESLPKKWQRDEMSRRSRLLSRQRMSISYCPDTQEQTLSKVSVPRPSKMIRDWRIPSEKSRLTTQLCTRSVGVRLIAEVQQGSRSAWGCQLEGETERARFCVLRMYISIKIEGRSNSLGIPKERRYNPKILKSKIIRFVHINTIVYIIH